MSASPGLLAAVERGAREQWIWRQRHDGLGDTLGWNIRYSESSQCFVIWLAEDALLPPRRAGRPPLAYVSTPVERRVDGQTASAWMLLAGLTVERPCPLHSAVHGDANRLTFHQAWGAAKDLPQYDKGAWKRAQRSHEGEQALYLTGWLAVVYGDCECGGSGRVHVEARRRLLDANEWVAVAVDLAVTCDFDGCSRAVPSFKFPVGPGWCDAHNGHTPRADLTVLSDLLRQRGDPRGGVLALWLAGELREDHVLGVETMDADAVDERQGREGLSSWVRPEGWTWAGPCGTWTCLTRPTLEARPT